MANGRLQMVQIQDVASGVWYTWSNRAWNTAPKCTGNRPLYIAVSVTNQGSNGVVTIRIQNALNQTIALKSQSIARNASFGLEYNGTMPNANLPLTIAAIDGTAV